MEPEDLMSDSVLVVLEKYEAIKNEIELLPYLIGIANNIIRKKIRRKKIVSFFGLDAASDQMAYQRTDLSVELQDLYKALNQLSIVDKETVILYEISGFSIKEIAKMTHASESAVKTRLHRSRKKLREFLSDLPQPKVSLTIASKAGGIG